MLDKSHLVLDDKEDMPEVCNYCPSLSRKRHVCRELKEFLTIDIKKERYSKCPLTIKNQP